MKIHAVVAGALALAIPAVPSLAFAQQRGNNSSWGSNAPPYAYGSSAAPYYATPEPSYTPVTIVPPAYGAVFVYDGRRLVGRFDGPGAIWLPSGRIYGVVAMRGEQVLWNGNTNAAGAPVELRWPAPPEYNPQNRCPYAYPSRPLATPIERGRYRTPLP